MRHLGARNLKTCSGLSPAPGIDRNRTWFVQAILQYLRPVWRGRAGCHKMPAGGPNKNKPPASLLFRLCQHDLTVSSALHWLTALNELHQAHPDLREHLKEREFQALGGFAIIIDFINKLHSAIPLPAPSDTKGRIFTSRLQVERDLYEAKMLMENWERKICLESLSEPYMGDYAVSIFGYWIRLTPEQTWKTSPKTWSRAV